MIPADENPFRVERIEALGYRAPGFDWDALLARLAERAYRGAIVGPHGAGKTTLLLEARRRLEARGIPVFHGFLNEETPAPARRVLQWVRELPGDTVFLLDGAEQVNPLAWGWIRWRARRLRGLVVTAHRPGLLPELYQAETDEALLRALLEELAPGAVEAYWPVARRHFRECGGNIRAVWFALYDECARGY